MAPAPRKLGPAYHRPVARMFVALALPAAVRRLLAALRPEAGGPGLARARWAPEAQLHLTLRFIGEVAEDALPALRRALAEGVRAAPFVARVEGVGTFGRPARVLFAGMAPAAALADLAAQVDAAVRSAGGPPADKPFHPHVTLARLREPSPAQLRALLEAQHDLRSAPFEVDAITLYRSTLSAAGAHHAVDTELALPRRD